MPCISDPERCWYFSWSPSWLSISAMERFSQLEWGALQRVGCGETFRHQAHWLLPEELVLFGTYQCSVSYDGDVQVLKSMPWILTTAWEILALCLAGWIAIHHFRDLQRHSAGGIIGDFVTVLMKTHAAYFSRWPKTLMGNLFRWSSACASFVIVSFFWLGEVSPTFTTVCCTVTVLGIPWRWWIHCFYRTCSPWNLKFIAGSFKSSWSCSCLWWDRAWSLASDVIVPSSWPPPMQERAWFQLLSRSADICQPAVVYSMRNAWCN